MEYSANCGGNFCPAIGSTGVISADHHLSLFCFVLVGSYLRSCLTVLCVGSFRFATQLASPAATDGFPCWGFSGCVKLFRGFLHGKENWLEEAEAGGNLDSFGETCVFRLHVEGRGRNVGSLQWFVPKVDWEVLMQFRSRKTRASNLVSHFSRFVIYPYLFTCECSLIISYRGVMCLCVCCQ